VTPLAMLAAATVYIGTLHQPIHDADSWHLDTAHGRTVELRLHRVDAPEVAWPGHPGEPGGVEARDALTAWVGHRPLTCTATGQSTHARPVVDCTVDGQDVATWLAAGGWAYPSRYGGCALVPLEERARTAGLGIFGIPESERVFPWVWRGRSLGGQACPGERS